MLRNLYFVSSRLGQNASTQYTFVNLTAIDILSQYPGLAETFLRNIKPSKMGEIPEHPLERCLDLFFLNTAEHFTLVLSPEANEELLISAALPYLAKGGDNRLLEIFEAAHSVVLAVLASPRSAEIAAKHLPYYIDNLFAVCLPYHILMMAIDILAGIPAEPLWPPIPSRLQDCHENHSSPFAARKQPAPLTLHPPRTRPRPRIPCIPRTPAPVSPGSRSTRTSSTFPSPLRTSRPHPRPDRQPLLPPRRRPGGVAPADREADQRDPGPGDAQSLRRALLGRPEQRRDGRRAGALLRHVVEHEGRAGARAVRSASARSVGVGVRR